MISHYQNPFKYSLTDINPDDFCDTILLERTFCVYGNIFVVSVEQIILMKCLCYHAWF